jgi:hypothetical protein
MGVFVTVKFDDERIVLVDGVPVGTTNKLIEVPVGTHVFELKGRKDYIPFRLTVDLSYTSLAAEDITFKRS